MKMFPLEDYVTEEAVQENVSGKVDKLGTSMRFDLKQRRFVLVDGKPETGMTDQEKVQQWFELLIHTQPDRFGIYGETGFGVDTEGLIGYKSMPKGFVYSEFRRELEESCAMNPIIDYLYDFHVKSSNGVLTISFTAHLYTGEEKEVTLDV